MSKLNDKPENHISITIFASWIGIISLAIYLLYIGKSIFLPLVLSIYITYLIKALASLIESFTIKKIKVPGFASLTLSIIILFSAIGILVQVVAENISQIASEAPNYQTKLQIFFNKFVDHAETLVGSPITIAELNSQISFQAAILKLVGALQGIAGSTFQIFLYVAFLLLESSTLHLKIRAFARNDLQEIKINKILKAIGSNIEKYIWIKTIMSIAVALLSYFILIIMKIDFAAFWALLIFILNYIPYIGSVMAVTFPVAISLIQYNSLPQTGALILCLIACQIFVGNILEPRVAAKSLNLSPVVILLSLSLWGSVWGVTGMILSVPIMVMIMIILSEFEITKPLAILMSQSGKIT